MSSAKQKTIKEIQNKNIERTMAIIKPNALNKAKEIEHIIVSEGFSILHKKRILLTELQAADFYKEHEARPFYKGLVQFMISDPVIVMILAREDAVSYWREIIGPTDPSEARKKNPESIRAIYGGKNITENAVHGSADSASAEREIHFFFPDSIIDSALTGEAAREYLAKTVNPTLLQGLIQLCKVKPHNPVLWLADWLLSNNPNKPFMH